jgi:hypothetical protein
MRTYIHHIIYVYLYSTGGAVPSRCNSHTAPHQSLSDLPPQPYTHLCRTHTRCMRAHTLFIDSRYDGYALHEHLHLSIFIYEVACILFMTPSYSGVALHLICHVACVDSSLLAPCTCLIHSTLYSSLYILNEQCIICLHIYIHTLLCIIYIILLYMYICHAHM